MRRAVAAAAALVTASAALAGVAAASTPQWGTYHRTPGREGDVTISAPGSLAKAWTATLSGAVYGQPLVANGLAYVATERDVVYALQLSTGKAVWARQVAHAVPQSQLPCGNIDPLGITGTMVLSPDGNTLYAAAEQQTAHGTRHMLYALDAHSGRVLWLRGLDVAPNREIRAEQQRGALAYGNGRVYVAFGGLDGDCNNYVGYVAGVPANGQGGIVHWEVPTPREGGIWAASGPAVGNDGSVYVSIGNGESTTSYDGSDSVTRLSPSLQRLGYFAPSQWAQDNAADADLGSMGPLLLSDQRVVVAGKGGTVYVTRPKAAGGIGAQQVALSGCTGFGGGARHGYTVYLPCTSGVRALQVGSGASATWLWQGPSNVTGSPVFAGGFVWALDTGGGTLYLLDARTGAARQSYPVGSVNRFMSPTVVPGWALVGTLSGVVAFRLR